MPIPGEGTIATPKDYGERRTLARRCLTKLKIDLPCLVDDMENSVEGRYGAAPDRIFLIDVDGKIAVRADQGPWGFKPGLEETKKWLEERFPKILASAAP